MAIRLDPVLRGRWAFQGLPARVVLLERRFTKAWLVMPYPSVVAQYREDVPLFSMHLFVHRDGTWSIDHTDEANPDRGYPFDHFFQDLLSPMRRTRA